MTRLIIEKDSSTSVIEDRVGGDFTLSSEDSHYLTHVLRFSSGDQLTVINPHTTAELLVKVTSVAKLVTVEIVAVTTPHLAISPLASLIYPLTKGSTLELVLEKGCELGVPHFMIWQAERSIVRLGDEREQAKKIERWQKILRSAAQQSLKAVIPTLNLYRSLDECIRALKQSLSPSDILLLASLESNALPMSERAQPGKMHHLIVGPEGDFTPAELISLERAQFLKTSLGPHRLRSETAALSGVSMVAGIAGFR